MRNEVTVLVSKSKGFCAAHFTQAVIVKDSDAKVSIPLRASGNEMITVPAPTKLQGADFELWFPLTATFDADKLNFEEVERIMIINSVANNVTNIEKKCGDEDYAEYKVTYNEWVHPDKK